MLWHVSAAWTGRPWGLSGQSLRIHACLQYSRLIVQWVQPLYIAHSLPTRPLLFVPSHQAITEKKTARATAAVRYQCSIVLVLSFGSPCSLVVTIESVPHRRAAFSSRYALPPSLPVLRVCVWRRTRRQCNCYIFCVFFPWFGVVLVCLGWIGLSWFNLFFD